MKKTPNNSTPEENLKNETELLKQKLEVENHAVIHLSDELKLPPHMEYEWFKRIYNYEKHCKESGYTTVYNFIGSPDFKKLSEIPPEKEEEHLNDLLEKLYTSGIDLCYDENGYPAKTLYKFITEELFQEKVCLYPGPGDGGHYLFCYEDFHPNHKQDILREAEEHTEEILGNSCYSQFLHSIPNHWIILNGEQLSPKEYSYRIDRFKENYPRFLFSEIEIREVEFDLETGKAKAKGAVTIPKKSLPFVIHFVFSHSFWILSEVELELL
jgi:hypothetical protein